MGGRAGRSLLCRAGGVPSRAAAAARARLVQGRAARAELSEGDGRPQHAPFGRLLEARPARCSGGAEAAVRVRPRLEEGPHHAQVACGAEGGANSSLGEASSSWWCPGCGTADPAWSGGHLQPRAVSACVGERGRGRPRPAVRRRSQRQEQARRPGLPRVRRVVEGRLPKVAAPAGVPAAPSGELRAAVFSRGGRGARGLCIAACARRRRCVFLLGGFGAEVVKGAAGGKEGTEGTEGASPRGRRRRGLQRLRAEKSVRLSALAAAARRQSKEADAPRRLRPRRFNEQTRPLLHAPRAPAPRRAGRGRRRRGPRRTRRRRTRRPPRAARGPPAWPRGKQCASRLVVVKAARAKAGEWAGLARGVSRRVLDVQGGTGGEEQLGGAGVIPPAADMQSRVLPLAPAGMQ